MDVKVKEAVFAKPTLDELSGKDLPIRAAFQIALLINKLQPILITYEERRRYLFETLGEADENGDLRIPSEKLDEANKSLAELGEESVAIEYAPMSATLFDGVLVKPRSLIALAPFIENLSEGK